MAPSRWLYIAFQSTHPRRVRRDGGDRYYDSSDVSIHAPTQGATNGFSGHLASSLSFNPRTHAGCDFLVRLEHRAARVVSIHAPTQGATLGLVGRARSGRFNPRTHAGCDAERRPCRRCPARFNPRTHAGCDATGVRHRERTHAGCDVCHLYALCVAIHAPTQGATEIRQSQTARRRSFNPRTHAGCDVVDAVPTITAFEFQSTHPRRVRPGGVPAYRRPGPVSIHAPTQGATASS